MISDCPLLSLLPSLRHPGVRDLCWVLSPQTDLLLSLPPFERFGFCAEPRLQARWLSALDATPQALMGYLATSNIAGRLGYYFEALLQFYFLHCPDEPLQLTAHNLPLYQAQGCEKKTVGELDFVLEHNRKRVHLEVAVKFYLAHQDKAQLEFLGPNARDSWARKLQHMSHHQLPMACRSDVEHELLPPDRSCFLVKGCLFSHWKAPAHTAQNTNPAATKNRWAHFSQLDDFLNQSEDSWYRLNKMQWLTGGDLPPGQKNPWPPEGGEKGRPFMLINQRRNIFDRVIVVPDTWPNA